MSVKFACKIRNNEAEGPTALLMVDPESPSEPSSADVDEFLKLSLLRQAVCCVLLLTAIGCVGVFFLGPFALAVTYAVTLDCETPLEFAFLVVFGVVLLTVPGEAVFCRGRKLPIELIGTRIILHFAGLALATAVSALLGAGRTQCSPESTTLLAHWVIAYWVFFVFSELHGSRKAPPASLLVTFVCCPRASKAEAAPEE